MIANFVLTLLFSDSNLAVIILVLVLFVTVSVVAVIYTFQKKTFMEQLITNAADVVDEKERLRKFSEVFSFTERESEVFNCLVNTEDSIQMIAEKLYVSRRTLERWGKYLLVRPDPQVIWDTPKTDRGWKNMNGHYHRSKKGGGEWEFFKLPQQWQIHYGSLTFNLKPFSFKQQF